MKTFFISKDAAKKSTKILSTFNPKTGSFLDDSTFFILNLANKSQIKILIYNIMKSRISEKYEK
jgi:hypothetical protein